MTQPPPSQPQHPEQPVSQAAPHPAAPPTWMQGHASPQQSGWSPSPSPASPRRRPNVFAIAALVVAGLMVLTGPAQQVAFQIGIESSDSPASLGAISTIFSVAGLVLALVTLALGVVGLVVPDRGRLLAAAAVGIGATSVVGTILGFATGVALSVS